MTKILTVLGARPQFIKSGVVSRAFKQAGLEEIVVHTGQHFDDSMSAVFFDELKLSEPKYNLGIADLSHGAMTGRMIEGIEKIILDESPNVVLVYGDTNSTLAGALAAKKQYVKVAHVEAGLRSFDMRMPEEINRILTDRLSDYLFCPTSTAVDNLRAEGYENFDCEIVFSGDVMFDSVMAYKELTHDLNTPIITSLPPSFALCTIHREENTASRERLENIFAALNEINRQLPVVLPVHPRTRKLIERYAIPIEFDLRAPASYLEMLALLERSSIVLTDSGGLQKEAFFMGRQCITLRTSTEWTELLDSGCNVLAGNETADILAAWKKRTGTCDFSQRPYGSGNAASKIVEHLDVSFSRGNKN